MVLVAVEAVDAILGVDRDRGSAYLDMLWRALRIPMDAIAVVTLADDLFHCTFPPVAALLALTMFDIATLRARRTNKWHKFPPDVLPAWVADMDFGVAPSITAALTRLTQ